MKYWRPSTGQGKVLGKVGGSLMVEAAISHSAEGSLAAATI
jgi:hypothetical protein